MQNRPIILTGTAKDSATINYLLKHGVKIIDLLNLQIEEAKKIPWIKQRINHLKPRDLGSWIFFPWRNSLVRLLKKDFFLDVKSSRNLFLLTNPEQKKYSGLKIGIAGMTVGSMIARTLVLETCGSYYKLADNDNISISNLNRLDASVCDLNKSKVILASEKLYEINPYLTIKVYKSGITKQNVNSFFSNPQLDIVIEEVDDLAVKVLMRRQAKKTKTPLIMATALESIVLLDYEAYGREENEKPFHGELSQKELRGLSSKSLEKKSVGARRIIPNKFFSQRLKNSFSELGKTINAFPQLAAGTLLRGAAVAFFIKELFIFNTKIKSGRYVIDLKSLLK